MTIYLDADSSPKVIKEILFRAAERVKVNLVLVANTSIKIPESTYISSIVVSSGFDEADNKITELVNAGDLVITEDIPLADRVIDKGGFVVTPRGVQFTKENIKERLAIRDMMDLIRTSGVETGGPAPFSQKETRVFAGKLDSFLVRYTVKHE
jgi:uncharacterized protein YaiI (UPF0178 family)